MKPTRQSEQGRAPIVQIEMLGDEKSRDEAKMATWILTEVGGDFEGIVGEISRAWGEESPYRIRVGTKEIEMPHGDFMRALSAAKNMLYHDSEQHSGSAVSRRRGGGKSLARSGKP